MRTAHRVGGLFQHSGLVRRVEERARSKQLLEVVAGDPERGGRRWCDGLADGRGCRLVGADLEGGDVDHSSLFLTFDLRAFTNCTEFSGVRCIPFSNGRSATNATPSVTFVPVGVGVIIGVTFRAVCDQYCRTVHILFGCNGFEMIRIDACSIATQMIDLQPLRNGTPQHFPDRTMCENVLGPTGRHLLTAMWTRTRIGIRDLHSPIAGAIEPLPLPASARSDRDPLLQRFLGQLELRPTAGIGASFHPAMIAPYASYRSPIPGNYTGNITWHGWRARDL